MIKRHIVRIVPVAAALAALLLVAGPARAASRSSACVAAYKDALKHQEHSRLREAQKSFTACAQSSCSGPVRRECLARTVQLESDIPSIVPVATDDAGNPISDVKVSMDGELLSSRVDGRAVAVDPGLHEFAFKTDALGTLATQKIVILQGQRNRPITISLQARGGASARKEAPASAPTAAVVMNATMPLPSAAAPAAMDAPASSGPESEATSTSRMVPAGVRRVPAASYILGGVGLLGVGGYALLTYWGNRDNDKLAGCTPFCPQETLPHIKRLYLGANVALGVGVVALGAATWLYVRNATSVASDEVAAKRGPTYSFDVSPIRAGAAASVAGRF